MNKTMNRPSFKKIGFFKLGKAIKFNEKSWGAIGGDNEPRQLIVSLAKLNPDIEYWVLSPNDLGRYRNKLKKTEGSLFDSFFKKENDNIPENIKEMHSGFKSRNDINEFFEKADSLDLDAILFYTGPTSRINVPDYIYKKDGNGYTKTLDFFLYYVAPIINFLNKTKKKIPIVGMLVDNRYIMQARDFSIHNRPTYYLAQSTFRTKEEYYTDPPHRDTASINVIYEYSGIETVFLLDKKPFDTEWLIEQKENSKLLLTQNQGKGSGGGIDRWDAIYEYIVNNDIEADIYGQWDDDLLEKYPMWLKGPKRIESLEKELIKTKYTFCVPIKKEMATSKYIEMLHYGIIPFLHPYYDSQCNVFPQEHFLRCKNPANLKKKISLLEKNKTMYKQLIKDLMSHFLKDEYYDGRFLNEVIWNAFTKIKS